MQKQLSSNWQITPEIYQILVDGKQKTIAHKPIPFGAFLQKPNHIGFDLYHLNKNGYSQKGQHKKEGLKKC